MIPIYLSPDQPRWAPTTEEDIQSAIDDGLLEESHHLDLKEALVSKGDNRELARDLASFAVDSGTLIIGIAEDKSTNTFSLAPQPLAGLPEKVERVARTLPDPPLSIVTERIPSEGDRGYLVVHIPASPSAPHMVDGRYYGRGDKTKDVLSDPEVTRLHERRRASEKDALALLQHEIERDPIPAGKQAHFFFVAQPLAAPRDMLKSLVSGPEWSLRLAPFIEKAYTPELNSLLGNGFHPPITYTSTGYRVSRGAARATHNLSNGRIYTPDTPSSPEKAVELQVHEDGGMRLYNSRLSEALPSSSDGEQVIFDIAAVDLTRRMLALLRVASEEAGYFGNWALAVGATKLRGLRVWPSPQWSFAPEARFDEDVYREAAGATWAELTSAPGAITEKLVGPLLRALDAEQPYIKLLQDGPPS